MSYAEYPLVETRMVRWSVYRGRHHIDTVFYTSDCDAEYVRTTLINHDGYPANIVVVKE